MPELNVADLHGEMETERNQRAIRRVLCVFAVLTLIAAAAVCASLIWRDASYMNNPNETPSQIITIAVTLVWGAIIIFFWSMKLSPRLSYRRYLREIHSGISRDVEGVIVALDEDTAFRDGLSFYRMVVNVGDLEAEEDERILYWDAQMGKPELAVGDRVAARAHGNDIIGLEKR